MRINVIACVLSLILAAMLFGCTPTATTEDETSQIIDTSSTESATSEAKPSSEPEPGTKTPTSSKIPATTTSKKTTSKCAHPNYFEDDSGLHWIGGWSEVKPGVENRYELYAECNEPRDVIYKCLVCSEPVLYETLEPLGHDFSGKDEVLLYPTVNSVGSYGKRCQRFSCQETMLTTPIPKRGGSYATIDSCLSVDISGYDNRESYFIENPDVRISDARTWGNVPTITFDAASCTGTISFIKQDGTLFEVEITVDKDLLSQGWGYRGTISESGGYSSRYSRWGFDGATPD